MTYESMISLSRGMIAAGILGCIVTAILFYRFHLMDYIWQKTGKRRHDLQEQLNHVTESIRPMTTGFSDDASPVEQTYDNRLTKDTSLKAAKHQEADLIQANSTEAEEEVIRVQKANKDMLQENGKAASDEVRETTVLTEESEPETTQLEIPETTILERPVDEAISEHHVSRTDDLQLEEQLAEEKEMPSYVKIKRKIIFTKNEGNV